MFALPESVQVRSGRHSSSILAVAAVEDASLRLKKTNTFQVPLSISRRFRDVQFKTLVGLAPIVPAAWYSVDDTVLVWRFDTGVSVQVQCDGIVTAVAVGLAVPGVFPGAMLDFIVCVCTENSVTLVGLKDMTQVTLEGYSLVGGSSFTRAAISATGKVFLWNPVEPSTLCELRYRASASWFRSKIYLHAHSLLGRSSPASSVWSFLFTPKKNLSTDTVSLFFTPSFSRYFVSVTSSTLRLHEIEPTPCNLATGAWRHAPQPDVGVVSVATMAFADRVLDAHVDSSDNRVVLSLLTEAGEVVSYELVDGELRLVSQHQVPVADGTQFSKKPRLSGGRRNTPLLVGAFGSVDGSLVVAGTGGLSLSLAKQGVATSCELGGNVLALGVAVPVIRDAYGSFVSNMDSGPVLVLTGKGVTMIEEDLRVESVLNCDDALKVLQFGAPNELLAFRKDSDADIWAEALEKYYSRLVSPVRHESCLVTVSGGLVRVAIAQPVLENIAARLALCVKFSSRDTASDQPMTAAMRREFMHQRSRLDLIRIQRKSRMNALATEMTRIGESLAFLAIVSEYHSTAVQQVSCPGSVFDIQTSWLKQTCERLLQTHTNGTMVEKLKSHCPSVLCLVSPTSIPFSPEGISAMLHCVYESNAGSVQLVLEAVRALARNTPSVAKSLNELVPILHQEAQGASAVIEAFMEGLGGRLSDSGTVSLVLDWAGSHLNQSLNESVFSFCFTRGLGSQFVHLSSNSFLESYLLSRHHTDSHIAEAYVRLLVRTSRASLAGTVLESLATSTEGSYSVFDRMQWLEEANTVYATSKRFTAWAVVRYIQIPLMLRSDLSLSTSLVPLSLLFDHLADWSELELVAYLLSPVSESEIVKTWIRVLFEKSLPNDFFSIDHHPVVRKNTDSLISFLGDLYAISDLLDAFDIWKKMDLIVAMAEYLLVANDNKESLVDWLTTTARLTTTQIIPMYMKALREMNKWVGKIPKANLPRTVSNEELEAHFVDIILELASSESLTIAEAERCMSLLILLRNYLKHQEPERVQEVIDQLATRTTTAPAIGRRS